MRNLHHGEICNLHSSSRVVGELNQGSALGQDMQHACEN